MNKLYKNKQVITGAAIIITLAAMSVLAPLITKYDYSDINLALQLSAPGQNGFLLGSDHFGRDLWTRLVYGGRVTLFVSLLSALFAGAFGTVLGITGGYLGKGFDFVLGRIMDIMMAFPSLLLSILMGAVMKPNITNMFIIIGIPLIPGFYRIIRGQTLSVRERGYVKAAISMGAGHFHILKKHIFPNVLPQFFIMFSFSFGSSIMAESALGFLGLGVPAPTPSWGLIVNEGRDFIFKSPWMIIFSCLLISLSVFGFNLLGDGARDCLAPKHERLQ